MERTLINASDAQLLEMKQLAERNSNPALAVHFRRLLATVEAETEARKQDSRDVFAELLESITTRFRIYNEGGRVDSSVILSPEATTEASELWSQAAAPNGNAPMPVLQALAWFHWARYDALPQDEDRNDLQAAVVLFAPVFLAAPGEVPDEARDFLETYSPAALIDNERRRGDNEASYVYRTYPNAVDYALALSRS